MVKKPLFFSETEKGDYVMTNKVVLVLKVRHTQRFPHSLQDLNTIRENLEAYLSRTLNTHGNPRMEVDTLVWGEPCARKKTS